MHISDIRTCPYCRGMLMFDDTKDTTWHREPVCPGWEKFCRDHGAQTIGTTEVLVVKGEVRRVS